MPAVADINLLYTISVLANQLKVLDLSFSLSVDDDAISNTIGKFCQGNLNHIMQFRAVGGFLQNLYVIKLTHQVYIFR